MFKRAILGYGCLRTVPQKRDLVIRRVYEEADFSSIVKSSGSDFGFEYTVGAELLLEMHCGNMVMTLSGSASADPHPDPGSEKQSNQGPNPAPEPSPALQILN